MNAFTAMLAVAGVLLVLPVHAKQEEFCAGFSKGHRSAKGDKGDRGDKAPVPACPVAPTTPIGSTPYREGIKAGLRAARKT